MKRITLILAAFAALLCSCAEDPIIISNIELNAEKCTLAVGETKTLIATIYPEDATDRAISWVTSDMSVAGVIDGTVTGIAPGTATVTVKSGDGKVQKSCEITVLKDIIHVEDVKLQGSDGKALSDFRLRKGDSTQLGVTISPADATDATVIWTSSDSTVFTVNDGLVKAVGSGKATLTAYTADGGLMQSVVISISNPATSITLEPAEISLYEYTMMYKLKAIVEPAGNDSKLVWTSSNEDLVMVSPLGEISTGQVNGKDFDAVIKVSSADDTTVSAVCRVTVNCKVSGVRMENTDIYVKEGSTAQARAIVYPSRAGVKDMDWTSSDSSIASVDADGLITGHKAGLATLTVKTKDGGKEASCKVHVISRVASISLSASEQDIPCGSSFVLKATLNPGNATFPGVKWTSSNEKVASVDSTGKVSALATGYSTIIASACDGGFTATCEVHVTSALTSITLRNNSLDMYQGASANLGLSYTPADATDVNIKWESSDTTVVQVVNGTAIAVGTGKASVTASCGNIKDNCSINVYVKVTGINLDKKSISIRKGGSETLKAILSPAGNYRKEDSTVEWESSDESVASVTQDGKVTGLKSGEAVVTAYSADRKLSSKCSVTVSNPIQSFKITPANKVLYQTETIQLSADGITPADADKATFIWESSNNSIATVSPSGLVTALKAGKATITAKVSGNESIKATADIEVLCSLTGISLSTSKLDLPKGQTQTINVNFTPADASDKQLIWTSSDETIVKVTDGKIEALNTGTATVTATAVSDSSIKAECTVTVTVAKTLVSSLTPVNSSITVTEGDSWQARVKVFPDEAEDKSVSWSSSNKSVATVTADGLIKAVAPGTATITVKANDGGNASCTMNVTVLAVTPVDTTVHVKSISLVESVSTIYVGETKRIHAVLNPANTTDKGVTWSVNTSSVNLLSAKCGKATSNAVEGILRGIKPGTARVTISSNDNYNGIRRSVTITVTVLQREVNITLSTASLTMKPGEQFKLNATVKPTESAAKGISWSSSDTNVAKVDSNGNVTAVKEGTATIKAKTVDGGMEAVCTVKVSASGTGAGKLEPVRFTDI